MKKLTREDGSSPDLVAENIERLREIFPEVFAEGRIDFDALKQTLGDYAGDREERYSFTWHGKSKARRIAQMPLTATLRPCPRRSTTSSPVAPKRTSSTSYSSSMVSISPSPSRPDLSRAARSRSSEPAP